VSTVRDPNTDQQLPVPGKQAAHEYVIGTLPDERLFPDVRRSLETDMRARLALGISKYGHPLESFNGRDARADALEEALDLMAYLGQMILEGEPRADVLLSAVVQVAAELTARKLADGKVTPLVPEPACKPAEAATWDNREADITIQYGDLATPVTANGSVRLWYIRIAALDGLFGGGLHGRTDEDDYRLYQASDGNSDWKYALDEDARVRDVVLPGGVLVLRRVKTGE
jgi:hypothetical protein